MRFVLRSFTMYPVSINIPRTPRFYQNQSLNAHFICLMVYHESENKCEIKLGNKLNCSHRRMWQLVQKTTWRCLWHQANTWSSDNCCQLYPEEQQTAVKFGSKQNHFLQQNAFEDVICNISSSMFWAAMYQSLSDLAVNGTINRTVGIGERSIKSYCCVPRNAFTVAGAIKWPQWWVPWATVHGIEGRFMVAAGIWIWH